MSFLDESGLTKLANKFFAVIGTKRLSDLNTTNKNSLVDAVNELNSNFDWKQVGYATNGSKVTLPTDYRELMLILNAPDSSSYSFVYPKVLLDDFTLYPTSGGYASGANYCVNLKINKETKTAEINRVIVQDTDYTNASSLYVFAR